MLRPSTWTKTIVASMTSYIDAGSIVAGAAGLALWDSYLQMSEIPLQLPFTITIPYVWIHGLDFWTINSVNKIG
ncbi:MAG: hypothetical protein LBP87_12995, partial [Planctomycetaceae bacterium]|nr:hypothetical protein [Planctomycetaceae bacterium]